MKRKIDLGAFESLVKNSGLGFKTTTSSYVFSCPRCKKPDKLWLYRNASAFICFSCAESGFKGRVELALAELLGRPEAEIVGIIKPSPDAIDLDGVGLIIDIRDDDDDNDEDEEAAGLNLANAPDLEWPTDSVELDSPKAARGVEYLLSRGVSVEIAMQYDIRYDAKYRSIQCPVYHLDRLLGWQSRATGALEYQVVAEDGSVVIKKRPKIMSTKNMPRDKVLMFQNRMIGSKHAVLCEGPFDALKCHFVGGNVASMGKSVSDGQLLRIKSYGVSVVYLGLDPDARSSIPHLTRRIHAMDMEVRVVDVAPYKDLGEMTMTQATDAVMSARIAQESDVYINV